MPFMNRQSNIVHQWTSADGKTNAECSNGRGKVEQFADSQTDISSNNCELKQMIEHVLKFYDPPIRIQSAKLTIYMGE